MLNKQAILERGKIKTRVVQVPEWAGDGDSGEVTIRQLTAGELLELRDDNDGSAAIAKSIVDESGARFFTDEEIPLVKSLAAAGRLRLNRIITEFNGIADIAETAKN